MMFVQDAVDQQPEEWKEDHLLPGQTEDVPEALGAYHKIVGLLLKHVRSHLRELVSNTISPIYSQSHTTLTLLLAFD